MDLVCLWNDTRFVTMPEIPPLNDGLTAVQADIAGGQMR